MIAPAALCCERGCGDPVAVTGGRAWERCPQCAIGNKPAVRRARQAAARADAMPRMVIPEGAAGFRLPGPPVTKNEWHMPQQRGRRGLVVTPKARSWMEAVNLFGRSARPRDWSLDGEFSIEILCVFTSPLADSSGPLELVKDALQGALYRNDRQVNDSRSRRLPPDGAPRLEVIVRRLGGT